jgi:hypothetical protein
MNAAQSVLSQTRAQRRRNPARAPRGREPNQSGAVSPSIDRLIEVSVNVPLPVSVSALDLAHCLQSGTYPAHHSAHLSRLLEEVSLDLLLTFCDHHDISAEQLISFARSYRTPLGLFSPRLEAWADELVPHR